MWWMLLFFDYATSISSYVSKNKVILECHQLYHTLDPQGFEWDPCCALEHHSPDELPHARPRADWRSVFLEPCGCERRFGTCRDVLWHSTTVQVHTLDCPVDGRCNSGLPNSFQAVRHRVCTLPLSSFSMSYLEVSPNISIKRAPFQFVHTHVITKLRKLRERCQLDYHSEKVVVNVCVNSAPDVMGPR